MADARVSDPAPHEHKSAHRKAWTSLLEAKAIDVRSGLAALAKEKVAAWFAETMPKITDIQSIAGALNLTLV